VLRRFRFQMSSWLSDGATPLAENVLINHVIDAFTIYKSQSTQKAKTNSLKKLPNFEINNIFEHLNRRFKSGERSLPGVRVVCRRPNRCRCFLQNLLYVFSGSNLSPEVA